MIRKLALSVLVLAATAAALTAASLAAHTPRPGAQGRPVLATWGSLPRLASAAPGARASSVISVANRSATRADLALELRATGSSSLRSRLLLTVARAGRTLYAGPYPSARRLHLGLLAGGGRQTLRVSVTLRAGAGNAVQGRSLSMDARFLAEAA